MYLVSHFNFEKDGRSDIFIFWRTSPEHTMVREMMSELLKSFKRKKKRAAWKERIKIISEEKALSNKEKEARKFKKRTKKQRDAFEEKQ